MLKLCGAPCTALCTETCTDIAPPVSSSIEAYGARQVQNAPRGCTVQRVYAPVDDSILAKIDEDAKEKGISRAQWVSTAIGAYLHRGEVLDGAKLEEMTRELHQLRTDKEESWRQITHLKRTEEKSRTEATQAQAKADKLQAQADQAQRDLAGAREELTLAKAETAKLKETLELKNDEVSFLRGHVAQLTQSISQFALKPGEEEIKKKGWWQFWK